MSSAPGHAPEIDFENYKRLDYGGNGVIEVGLKKEDASQFRLSGKSFDPTLMYKLIVKKTNFNLTGARESLEKEVKTLKHVREGTLGNDEFYHKFSQLVSAESYNIHEYQKFVYLQYIVGINLREYRYSHTRQDRTGSPSLMKEPNEERQPIPISALRIPMIYHIFAEVFSAMNFMHDEMKMIHGDIKADNIIVRESAPGGLPWVVLIDFGCSILEKDGFLNYKSKVIFDRLDFFRVIVDLVRDHKFCGEMRCKNEDHHRPSECLEHKGDCKNWYYQGCDQTKNNHTSLWQWDEFVEELEGCQNMTEPWFQGFKTKWLKEAPKKAERDAALVSLIGRELNNIIRSNDYQGKNISEAEVSHGIKRCGESQNS